MSLYTLTPKPGCERYTVQVGWNAHRSYFATVLDFAWDPVTEPDNEPDAVRLGIDETILDPTDVLIAVEPYADLPDDILAKLRADKHPVCVAYAGGRVAGRMEHHRAGAADQPWNLLWASDYHPITDPANGLPGAPLTAEQIRRVRPIGGAA